MSSFILRVFSTAFACASLSACSSIPFLDDSTNHDSGKASAKASSFVPQFIKPYRVEVQQGNFVSAEDTSRIQLGMSKNQVRFILGTPLLQDPFHENRWDYPFRLLHPNGHVEESRYTIFFRDGIVVRYGYQLPQTQSNQEVKP